MEDTNPTKGKEATIMTSPIGKGDAGDPFLEFSLDEAQKLQDFFNGVGEVDDPQKKVPCGRQTVFEPVGGASAGDTQNCE